MMNSQFIKSLSFQERSWKRLIKIPKIGDFGLDHHHHQHANILDTTLDFEMRI